jgi:hypothetical protein
MNASASAPGSPLRSLPGQPTLRLYDCVGEALRSRHCSRRTEEACLHWIRRFPAFHSSTHAGELSEREVNSFLSHLAVDENMAASTENQALAGCFPLPTGPGTALDRVEGAARARKPKRLPWCRCVTRSAILTELDGVPNLVCALLHVEAPRRTRPTRQRPGPRRGEIIVWQGKGQKDRVDMLLGLLLQPSRITCSRDALLGCSRGPISLEHSVRDGPT